ncbi:MAG: DUF928 domain-containing protein [Leptolyngbyaceae cyanobacterium MO_188.B28]|nr:DUF928 domain-containing protein [Leptolyngbyaceae cyanobacterium MO_188.B28]
MQTQKVMAAIKPFSILLSSATLLVTSLLSPLPSRSIEFPSTGNRGGPARTTGGGVRGGDCSSNVAQSNPALPLTPLLPLNANGEYQNTFVDDSVMMQFYVPDGIDNQYAEVYVEDPDTGEVIHDKIFFLTNSPKILQLSFPALSEETGEALEIDKDYLWEFSIICDFRDRGLDIYTSGYMRRVDAPTQLPSTLERKEDWTVAKADRYAQASIWQESLQILDHLKCNSQEEWAEFLNSVGLHGGITEVSLNQCSAE